MNSPRLAGRLLLAASIAGAGVVALPVLAAAPATAAVPETGPIGTAETRLSSQDVAGGVGATTAAYDPGQHRYLVAWSGARVTDGARGAAGLKYEILGRFVDAETGATIGQTMTLASIGAAADGSRDAIDPALAWDPAEGRYLLAYSADALADASGSTDATDFDVQLQAVGTDGVAVGAATTVSEAGSGNAVRADLDVTGQRILIAWDRESDGQATVESAWQVGEADPVVTAIPGSISFDGPAVALAPGGAGLVAWSGPGGDGRIRARGIVLTDGTPGTPLVLGAPEAGTAIEEFGVDVAAGPHGWTAVWTGGTAATPGTPVLRRARLAYDAASDADPAIVRDTVIDRAGAELSPSVSYRDDELLVSWVARTTSTGPTAGTGDHQVWVARVSDDSATIADVVRVSALRGTVNTEPTRPAVLWSDGRIGSSLVAWSGEATGLAPGESEAWARLIGGPPIDLTPPSLTLAAPPGPVSGAFDVTITGDEPITGLTLEDLVVENATSSNLRVDSATTYRVTLTPVADGTVRVSVPAGGAVDAAGNPSNATAILTRVADLTRPTAALDAPAGPLNAAFPVTVTFSESVTGFSGADLVITGGTVAGLSGSGTTYTAIVTPDPGATGTVRIELPAGAALDAAGNANTAAADLVRTIDRAAPTVVLSGPTGPQNAPFDVTLTFSEPVTGLGLDDLAVTNGVASELTGSGSAYSVRITPQGDGPLSIALPAGAATDAAGNPSLASAPLGQIYDATAPTLTLDADAGPFNAPFRVSIEPSEPVSGLTLEDIEVSGGTASDLQTVAEGYSVLITPSADGPVAVSIAAGAAQDDAGNQTPAVADLVRDYDGTPPALRVVRAPGQADPVRVGEVRFLVEMSEPLPGLDAADFAITGTTGADEVRLVVIDSHTVSVTVTGMRRSGAVGLDLAAAAVSDAAGNDSAAVSSPAVRWAATARPQLVVLNDMSCVGDTGRLGIALTVDDGSTLTVASSNPDLVPVSAASLRRDGTRLTLAVKPTAGRSGVARVRVTATNLAGARTVVYRVVVGTAGADVLRGSKLNDVLIGRGGDDLLRGRTRADLLCGGAGDDRLYGGGGRDALYGGRGDDVLVAVKGDDTMVGGPGRNTIVRAP
ncbi:Ig-like domain-containing protein [Nocardioides sp. GXZ039]|uniref:Ig-like domain-containing protein n=1 Tax=Nocardioides sp. GXZ039 TaxID=3136018 RepID=UPI0030F481F2